MVYTVHLLATDVDETELTWARESNPLVGSPYEYDATPNTDYSAVVIDSESTPDYLSITRPANSERGVITIKNTVSLDAFVGSYTLELRAHHQD